MHGKAPGRDCDEQREGTGLGSAGSSPVVAPSSGGQSSVTAETPPLPTHTHLHLVPQGAVSHWGSGTALSCRNMRCWTYEAGVWVREGAAFLHGGAASFQNHPNAQVEDNL